MSASCSRRRFLTTAAATGCSLGYFVWTEAGWHEVGRPESGEAMAASVPHLDTDLGTDLGTGLGTGLRPGVTNLVVKPTPSLYFVSRGSGSQEMKWGPVKDFGETVPNDRFYIHNRARPPEIDLGSWRLRVGGDAVARPRSFTYGELLALPQVTVHRTLDCGANCRAFFPRLPRDDGDEWLPVGFTQWHFGAVGAAKWTGVRAKDVLAATGLGHAADMKFTALDDLTFNGEKVHYSQVIPAAKVLQDDTLLAYRMNGEDLPIDHGYPLRALFSGWGGNTMVKWLGEIEASKRNIPASGPQTVQVLTGPDYPKPVRPTVGPVLSAIEQNEDVTLSPGDITLRGRAWSGAGAIDRVDVSVEKLVAPGKWVAVWDEPWRAAKLLSEPEPYMWVRFKVPWQGAKPGQYRVMSRARDKAGNTQPRPEDVLWNQHGLGYNGHAPLELAVLPGEDMP